MRLNRDRSALTGPVERQGIDPGSPWWTIHVARYRYARSSLEGLRVLDIACGTGYGLDELSDTARMLVGVDVDVAAAKSTRELISDRTAHAAIVANGASLPFADGSFDAVLSFETIEHLGHRSGFISELARVLEPEGFLLLSTPNANHTRPRDGVPRNPYHIHEYTPGELRAELAPSFASVEMYGQVLDPSFRIPPLWDEQEELGGTGGRARVLLWRALAKLPPKLGERASLPLLGQPLFPGPDDYHFRASEVERAPVLLALCRGRVR